MGLFKSKQQKQLERDLAIQNVLDLHRRRIKELKKHERGYCEKAVRARQIGDPENYQKLAKLLLQTMAERRRLESALLTFEAMVQTKERIESYGEFAKGLQAATKSIASVFKNIDLTKTIGELNLAMANARQMDRTMNMVLDRVSGSTLDYEPDDDGLPGIEQIDELIGREAEGQASATENHIDLMLREIETKLKKETNG